MPETRGKDTSEIAGKVAHGFRSRPLEIRAEDSNGFRETQWNDHHTSLNFILFHLNGSFDLSQQIALDLTIFFAVPSFLRKI